jgi:general secretion pathway protein D
MAPPEVEKKIVEIIQQLDKPGRQVMITAVLAEVKVGDGFSWGARVGRVGDFSNPLNGSENSVTGSIGLELEKGGDGNSSGNFASPWFDSSSLTISTTDDLAFFLQALSTDNSVRILQQPRVFTSDNKEAKFVAGSDVSFLTGETSGFQTGGTTQSSYQQQFVGVGVNVRPRITQDNNVAMEVEILLSNLSSTTINSNPVVDRRQTNTNVTVKNGQTIVISGIRREQETQIDRRIPFLGDIPLLGAAFSSTERSKEVVELVVFLVPIVVENPDANDGNFNADERERLKQLQEPLEKGSKQLLQESKFFQDIKKGQSVDSQPEADEEAEGLDKSQKTTP